MEKDEADGIFLCPKHNLPMTPDKKRHRGLHIKRIKKIKTVEEKD